MADFAGTVMSRFSRAKKICFSLLCLGGAMFFLEGALRIWGERLLENRANVPTEPKSRGEWRIVALGDSFTYGIGTKVTSFSYPSQLEKILTASDPCRPIRSINLGVPGSNLRDVLTVFEKKAKALDPDVLLVLVGLNETWKPSTPEELRQVDPDASHRAVRLFRVAEIAYASLRGAAPAKKPEDFEPSLPLRIPPMPSLKTVTSKLLAHASRLPALDEPERRAEAAEIARELENSAAVSSAQAFIQYQTGMIRWHLGQWEAAGEHFRRASELAPQWLVPPLEQGRLLLERGDFDEAIRCFARARERFPGSSLASLQWAGAMVKGLLRQAPARSLTFQDEQELETASVDAAIRLPAHLPEVFETLSTLSAVSPSKSREARWQTLLEKLLEKYPDRVPRALCESIRALSRADEELFGSAQAAFGHFDRALSNWPDPRDPDRSRSRLVEQVSALERETWTAYQTLRRGSIALGLPTKAREDAFSEVHARYRVRRQAVVSPESLPLLAACLFPHSSQRYREALPWEARDIELRMAKLEELWQSYPATGDARQHRELAAALRKGTHELPATSESLIHLAIIADHLGLTRDAYNLYRRSAELDPFRWEVWLGMGAQAYQEGRYVVSLEALEHAQAINPTDPEGTIMLANVLRYLAPKRPREERARMRRRALELADRLCTMENVPREPLVLTERGLVQIAPRPSGEGVPPLQLRLLLEELKDDLANDPEAVRILESRLSALQATPDPEAVYWHPFERALRKSMAFAFQRIRDYCAPRGIRLIVLSYPPADPGQIPMWKMIQETNSAIQDVCHQLSLGLIRFEEPFRELNQRLGPNEIWSSDWHPREVGYQTMAEEVAGRIRPLVPEHAVR